MVFPFRVSNIKQFTTEDTEGLLKNQTGSNEGIFTTESTEGGQLLYNYGLSRAAWILES